jgi:predicted metal-dependent hydrolase
VSASVPSPLRDDARLEKAISLFNEGDFLEASDLFEELFFEAVREEVPVTRALLQLSVGCLHAERRQRSAALGRLREALRAIDAITDGHGIDVASARRQTIAMIRAGREGTRAPSPHLSR